MNKLLKSSSIAVLYAAVNFFAPSGFANPDKIASSLAEVADDTTSSAASTIVRARVEEDLAELVSTVVLTGTAKDGAQSGRTLSEMLSGMGIVDTSVFTSPEPASLRITSCSLSQQDGQLDWRTLNRLNVSLYFNGLPSPNYTATYTLEIPGVKASGQLTFRTDDMTPQLRELFPRAIGISDGSLTFATSFNIKPPAHVRHLLDALIPHGQARQEGPLFKDADAIERIIVGEITALEPVVARIREALRTNALTHGKAAEQEPAFDTEALRGEVTALEQAIVGAREALRTLDSGDESIGHLALKRLEALFNQAIGRSQPDEAAAAAPLAAATPTEVQLRRSL